MTKVCRVCLKEVNIELFHDHTSTKDGKMKICIDCHRDVVGYKDHDPEHRARRVKNSQLMCSYGITIDQYEAMAKSQGNVCAICEGTQLDSRGLAVDHCHKTGRVRGLLCNRCNRAIGMLDDDYKLLEKAMTYLIAR